MNILSKTIIDYINDNKYQIIYIYISTISDDYCYDEYSNDMM